jgi:hypothetical protein
MSGVVRWVPWAAVAWLAGCGSNAFLCSDDASCGGADGRCEGSGYCSFPDPKCDSGRAYGEFSGALSGQCVPAGDETGGEASSTTSNPGPSSASSASATTSAPSTSLTTSDDGSTSSPISATADATSEGTSGSSGDASSTGADPTLGLCDEEATPVVEEGFSSLPLSARVWAAYEDGAVEVSAPGGVLHVGVDLPQADSPDAYFGAYALADIPASGSAGLEIHLIPDAADDADIVIGIEDASRLLMLDVFYARIYALIREPDGTYTQLSLVEFDPIAHRWIRVSWDAEVGAVAFETSPDRATWSTFHELDVVDFDFSDARLLFYGGAWNGPLEVDPVVAFDSVFMCSLD